MLGRLSEKYESSGNAGCVSSGSGDAGGKSYGLYQLSSVMGGLSSYLMWLINNGYWFGKYLYDLVPTSREFDAAWRWLAETNAEDFAASQHAYIRYAYYDPACDFLAAADYHADKHSVVMQDVVWSRAVQYGAGNIIEMWELACLRLGYPNLSYVDDISFDAAMISEIYGVCKSEEWTNGSPALRPGLYARFDAERVDALKKLATELGQDE
jgi:hypothetical protein